MQQQAPRHRLQRASADVDDSKDAAEIASQLDAGGESCHEALMRLQEPAFMQRLTLGPSGCRVVQQALDIPDRTSVARVAAGLKGAVVEAVLSPHGNHVVQKIINLLTAQEVPFIVEEIDRAGPELACHQYGCRVFCRLQEKWALDQGTTRLVDRVLSETQTQELAQDTYGHHVAECVLEHGLPEQRSYIIQQLERNIMRIAQSQKGAYVLEKAFLLGTPNQKQQLATALLMAPSSEIAVLTSSQWGCMAIRAMLPLPPSQAEQLRIHLQTPEQAQMRKTKHRDRLLAAVGLGTAVLGGSIAGERHEWEEQLEAQDLERGIRCGGVPAGMTHSMLRCTGQTSSLDLVARPHVWCP
jgi:hypothetical protein